MNRRAEHGLAVLDHVDFAYSWLGEPKDRRNALASCRAFLTNPSGDKTIDALVRSVAETPEEGWPDRSTRFRIKHLLAATRSEEQADALDPLEAAG